MSAGRADECVVVTGRRMRGADGRTMMVFELPPRADCRICVSFESRYGTKTFFLGLLAAHHPQHPQRVDASEWHGMIGMGLMAVWLANAARHGEGAGRRVWRVWQGGARRDAPWSARAEMTLPSDESDLLMAAPSLSRSPVAPVDSARSDPCASTPGGARAQRQHVGGGGGTRPSCPHAWPGPSTHAAAHASGENRFEQPPAACMGGRGSRASSKVNMNDGCPRHTCGREQEQPYAM
jgi:hypothetical protein